MAAVADARPIAHRWPTARCKDLLLGPPLATSWLVRERLGKVVALAVFSILSYRQTIAAYPSSGGPMSSAGTTSGPGGPWSPDRPCWSTTCSPSR